ncbi:galactokinase [Muriicola jejuensis]|uniref:Galactokinase n=1 Tax=Muriicola jejuensis TaxID=504488 RepID=A0A6P0UCQ4_9FLAO|nr:galactokinase [Muriicola jejuensis]NER09083.1 galactokinase [Muriicola jejuensis]SMP11375.1 galactokinase [Muriicola jejuensis]
MDRNLIESVRTSFLSRFGEEPVLIWSPGRINVIGEHTDYNQGLVLPAAIDMGIAMALKISRKGAGEWVAADTEEVYIPGAFQDIPEKREGWAAYFLGILQELHKRGIRPVNVQLVFRGNLPSGAGLSSSAALENAFIFGLNQVLELGLSAMEMVEISHAAEQNYVGVRCGIMDQYAGIFGRAGKAIFLDCKSLRSEAISMPLTDYQWTLLDTGVKHHLADSAYNERRETCESIARKCGVRSLREVTTSMLDALRPEITPDDYRKALFVLEENARVMQAVTAIQNNDLSTLGRLLYESHKGLKYQYEVSCEELDFLVDLAGERGVQGARMMGGGFGGCTLNLVKKKDVRSFIDSSIERYSDRFGSPCTPYEIKISDGCNLYHS